MARRSARPEAAHEVTLTPLKERCEQCGQFLWVAHHSHRTVAMLSGLRRMTLVVRQCIQPSCPRFHQPYRPEEEGRWALPYSVLTIAWTKGLLLSSTLSKRAR